MIKNHRIKKISSCPGIELGFMERQSIVLPTIRTRIDTNDGLIILNLIKSKLNGLIISFHVLKRLL